jgi:glycosyltransferase involved in cell wall biosynthesis
MKNQQPLKKVLIVAYYWPPTGGGGVQRWLKFVKYLPQFGWKPFVFTPKNPSFDVRDETLLRDVPKEAEVIHYPIWEPYKLLDFARNAARQKKIDQIDHIVADKKTLFQKIVTWIRGNVFIPDARIFWVRPAARFIGPFMERHEITTLVTTGPPHSLHLVGLKLKKRYPGIRWIADFRDPWSEWDLLDTLSLTSWARNKHRRLEREVLHLADKVITIAPLHVRRLEVLGGRKVDLVTNGFDDEDFRGIAKVRTKRFTIRHIGMVDELRDPRPVMKALRELAVDTPEFAGNVAIEFIGSVNTAFREFVNGDKVLAKITSFTPAVPHDRLLKLYGDTDVQLLVLAHTALAAGNLPGKFFEYLASGNHILGIGPEDGDAAEILKQTQAGEMIDRSDTARIADSLLAQFNKWKQGGARQSHSIEPFSRRDLTRRMTEMLE